MTAKMLEAAISKVIAQPEAAQDQIGRELLARVASLDELRADLQVGVDQLDSGLGEVVEIENVIEGARRKYAGR